MSVKKRVGVVADDITGANDIGVMFSKNGFDAVAASWEDRPVPQDFLGADAWIIHTASRLDSPALAAEKSRRAARFLLDAGCEAIYTKTCSVFRGNVGAAFDAVQDEWGIGCSMVTAGFPKNGRTTVNGLHYVYGKPLAESDFAKDPVNPMKLSRLKDIIGLQSKRPCREFTWEWLDKPFPEMERRLRELKGEASYVVFDARDQRDLKTIAALTRGERNWCGSSALAEELPGAWGQAGPPRRFSGLPGGGPGVLILAGSLTPETKRQVEDMKKRGVPFLEINPLTLFGRREETLEKTAEAAAEGLKAGGCFLVYASGNAEEVKRRGRALGMDGAQVGRLVTAFFQDAAQRAREDLGVRRFVAAGGETSDGVTRGLKVKAMRVWQEIEPGVPLLTARAGNGEEVTLVLKSGSFGSESFLWKAAEMMRAEN